MVAIMVVIIMVGIIMLLLIPGTGIKLTITTTAETHLIRWQITGQRVIMVMDQQTGQGHQHALQQERPTAHRPERRIDREVELLHQHDPRREHPIVRQAGLLHQHVHRHLQDHLLQQGHLHQTFLPVTGHLTFLPHQWVVGVPGVVVALVEEEEVE